MPDLYIMKAYYGYVSKALQFLTLVLDVRSSHFHVQAILSAWERVLCAHLLGGWVGSTISLAAMVERRTLSLLETE
jgi:hypothetical protein